MIFLRSYLFVPGNNLSIVKKAVSSSADCIILDLEDAVAHSEKEKARETVEEALLKFGKEKTMFVRINDIETSYWKKDVRCAVENGAKGIIVPKAESEFGIKVACDEVKSYFENAKNEFCVVPLIETAKGVQFAYEISSADKMIQRLAFGSIDFSLDIDCELTPSGLELLFARSQIVIASKAAGIAPPIDAVFPNLKDEQGLEKEARFARQVGFKSKLAIHPKQLAAIHAVFSPSEKEIAEAQEIVEAFEAAEKEGVASITVNNTLVDYPVYKKAVNLLLQVDDS